MFQETIPKLLWFVFVLSAAASAVWAKAAPREELRVTISVHNDAGASKGVLRLAESEASRIFRQSGIQVRWLNCLPPGVSENPSECTTAHFPEHLQLRIAGHSLNLSEFAMGVAYLSTDGTGCYADVFYDRALQIHESDKIDVGTILGHGFAHELGHLLLGINSHSATGLMRARWQPADLDSAGQGQLLFSPLESQQMRTKLAARQVPPQTASLTATAQLTQ